MLHAMPIGVRLCMCVPLHVVCVWPQVRPALHIFGHIHEGYGATTNGRTTFANASTCTVNYQPDNPPLVFDLPAPAGATTEGGGEAVAAAGAEAEA